jgi:SAM-dependent methyltransferase
MSDRLVFDRRQIRRQRDRAALALGQHDFLLRDVAGRLADRLLDTTRRFPLALDIGCHAGEAARALRAGGRIERLVSCDMSAAMAARAGRAGDADDVLVADEEALPFAERSFDLVASNLSLHWVNDLPGTLMQIHRVLKEDGLFLATLIGGTTLCELRQCLIDAELADVGGVSPRVSPFVDVRDAGALLQRAGFALPVVDLDTIVVTYASALGLLADLRGMGETNAVRARRKTFSRRATLLSALALYEQRFKGADGRLPATVQIITLTAWRPHPLQQRPLARGSGQADLARVLGGGSPVDGDGEKG